MESFFTTFLTVIVAFPFLFLLIGLLCQALPIQLNDIADKDTAAIMTSTAAHAEEKWQTGAQQPAKMEISGTEADSGRGAETEETMPEEMEASFGVAPMSKESEAEEKRRTQIGQKRKSRGLPENVTLETLKTSDEFYSELCRSKAKNFAILGDLATLPIWVANRSDKIVDVIKGLIDHNVSSVPVLTKDGKYWGFLDWMDIVKFVLRHFGPGAFGKERPFEDLVKEEAEFKNKTVDDVMSYPGIGEKSYYHALTKDYSGMACVEALVREPGNRRVLILDDRRNKKPVTQSQVVHWLYRHLRVLGPKKTKPVSMCPSFFKPVLQVMPDTKAIDAFETMINNNIQGVAVADENGKLVGNLSLRDLKAIGSDASRFWRLQQTVQHFLEKLYHERAAATGVRHRHALYVLPDATIEEVIVAFKTHSVHRLYICKDRQERKPIGVISLRDLILEIIE